MELTKLKSNNQKLAGSFCEFIRCLMAEHQAAQETKTCLISAIFTCRQRVSVG